MPPPKWGEETRARASRFRKTLLGGKPARIRPIDRPKPQSPNFRRVVYKKDRNSGFRDEVGKDEIIFAAKFTALCDEVILRENYTRWFRDLDVSLLGITLRG